MGVLFEFVLLLFLVITYNTAQDDFFNLSWYPEIKNRVDMQEFLRENDSLITTAAVHFTNRPDDPEHLEAIVGEVADDKTYYKLTQCLLDLFKRDQHEIQLTFSNISDLNRVVETLLLRDDPRIWIHLDLVPHVAESAEASVSFFYELNARFQWSRMKLSIGSKPTPEDNPAYTVLDYQEMKRIVELPNAVNLRTVFVVDGYIAQKQCDFSRMMRGLVLLRRVNFLLRFQPDKEDKVIVRHLNATVYALGGASRVYLDMTDRLREILLGGSSRRSGEALFTSNNGTILNGAGQTVCPQCRAMIIRKYIRCSANKMNLHQVLPLFISIILTAL